MRSVNPRSNEVPVNLLADLEWKSHNFLHNTAKGLVGFPFQRVFTAFSPVRKVSSHSIVEVRYGGWLLVFGPDEIEW